MDGLIAFRKVCPDAAIVVLSGSTNPAIARDALALGVIAYFPKSCDLGEMLEFVRSCVLLGVPTPHTTAPERYHALSH